MSAPVVLDRVQWSRAGAGKIFLTFNSCFFIRLEKRKNFGLTSQQMFPGQLPKRSVSGPCHGVVDVLFSRRRLSFCCFSALWYAQFFSSSFFFIYFLIFCVRFWLNKWVSAWKISWDKKGCVMKISCVWFFNKKLGFKNQKLLVANLISEATLKVFKNFIKRLRCFVVLSASSNWKILYEVKKNSCIFFPCCVCLCVSVYLPIQNFCLSKKNTDNTDVCC